MTIISSVSTDLMSYRAGWDRLYSAYAAYYKVEQTAEMRDRTWGWIVEGRIICLMALDDAGTPVGIAHLRDFLRPLMSTSAGFLDDLFVDPSMRGKNVVEALFEQAKTLGRDRGWSVIRWITRDDNYRARSVYDRIAAKTNWVTYDLIP